MAKKCTLHPSRDAVLDIGNKSYCQPCKDGQTAAAGRVHAHVEPKSCFVWYEGGATGWQPIPGTGCAHWVSHQKNHQIGPEGVRCLGGFTFRVTTLVTHLTAHGTKKAIADVQVGDYWVKPDRSHMGIVSKTNPLTIQHDSSALGGVRESDFDTYFHGQGDFYRL